MDRFLGKRLDGRYEIREIIGVGGMAVVYKAYDNVEDRTVAIKILKEEFVSNEEFIRRFKNESKAIAVLSHPNIVKVYDVSFGDLIQYIVMEHIDGITLKEYIERQGSLRWKDAVYFAIQILKGLQHAHDKGIVHRDVKPQNIMVLPDGTIKVTDFGIARFSRSEQRTITDKAIGSVHYISPEQARGEKTDEKADIYSVGVMLYEMLTGQLPFQAENAVSVAIMQLQRDPQLPTEINSSIPTGLEQITMHAMQKNLERRYQSAAEMLCDLEKFKKDPAITFEYPYFVDNSPTMFVSNVRSSTPASKDTSHEEEIPVVQPTERRKSATIPVLSGIAVALLIVMIAIGYFFILPWLRETGDEIPCPDFSKMSMEEIESEYGDTFDITWGAKYSDTVEKGEICDQSIKSGKSIKKGENITIYVSQGKQVLKMPDVYSKQKSFAISELRNFFKNNGNSDIKIDIVSIAHDDVASGCVIKTEPAADAEVSINDDITVYVSTGKPIKMITVPGVEKYSKDDAKNLIEEEGLLVEIIKRPVTPSDSTYQPDGYVIKQKPPEGSKLLEGKTVTIEVSDGNIKFDLKVEVSEKVKLEIRIGEGKSAGTSEVLDAEDLSEYTFKDFIATQEKFDATLYYAYGDDFTDYKKIADLKVNAMEGTVTVK